MASPPRRGEVYLVRLDPTEDSEQAGTRPAVVVSHEAINCYSPVIMICPLTDQTYTSPLSQGPDSILLSVLYFG